jgi:hypothetical protein
LWSHPDPEVRRARQAVTVGAAFVDAGGAEECLPTVRGRPDHGDVWTRRWSGSADAAEVRTQDGLRLRRRITRSAPLRIGYRISGPAGIPFVHAVHALLDVSPSACLDVPGTPAMTVLDDDAPVRPWPSGLDRLGPDDGTAVCVLLTGCREVSVVDGDDTLRFRWECPERPDACSLLVWRNLKGWPEAGPYRSIGVEPTVGRTADAATGPPGAALDLGPDGELHWQLEITATRR